MPDTISDRPFVLMMNLVLADMQGDYERAINAQRRLAELGWYVSRKPPEEPTRPKSKRSRTRSDRSRDNVASAMRTQEA